MVVVVDEAPATRITLTQSPALGFLKIDQNRTPDF